MCLTLSIQERQSTRCSGFVRTTCGPKVPAESITAGRRLVADEPACTPGSVPACGCPRAGGDHPSRRTVASPLQRSTRKLGRAALERFLSDLAPGGVYLAVPVTGGAGGLLHHRFTLTGPSTRPAVCSLWHCPAGHPGWALPTTLPCGARTFLGTVASDAAARLTRPPAHSRCLKPARTAPFCCGRRR